ncbi:DUF3667 domain-containing protein [Flavobacterium sp. 3HN19-14]|uniref:DUF3667 domain-containing protein n=1 Tax=Flavobacterium sp. 3HN19-14 TaxID=3448133 RepID=UPI003EE14EFE
MGKHKLRDDKTCLNCNYVVENRFCPNCGQENTETRKTFHHLFFHFFEDLTHYENAFWKTIKNLILRPASLTKEYLSGKRMSYLAPVRLYIFISFVTFLVLSLLPSNSDEIIKSGTIKDDNGRAFTEKQRDSLMHEVSNFDIGYKSVKELDSVQRAEKADEKMGNIEYWFAKKATEVREKHYTNEELKDKFVESFVHNIPKVLFLYMPFFAFILWLFHDKKKWYYFDHGIFTLHYFSFLLLCQLILNIISTLLECCNLIIFDIISHFINFAGILYMFYYFFPAHHRFYGGKRRYTAVKGCFMFFINMFFITISITALIVYTFINIK